MRSDPNEQEPTPDHLAAIEHEWPLIEAELALLDAEIRCLSADNGPSPLDRHRVRRAEARVQREWLRFTATPTKPAATNGVAA